jgi:hypothetical protein
MRDLHRSQRYRRRLDGIALGSGAMSAARECGHCAQRRPGSASRRCAGRQLGYIFWAASRRSALFAWKRKRCWPLIYTINLVLCRIPVRKDAIPVYTGLSASSATGPVVRGQRSEHNRLDSGFVVATFSVDHPTCCTVAYDRRLIVVGDSQGVVHFLESCDG